jgi:hypothetical protein
MAELTGAIGTAPGGTSVVFTTPYPLRPGTRARDVDGSEYIFCAYATAVYKKQPVQINSDFTAQQLGVVARGLIGVVTTTGTSDNAGWVQVFGPCTMQIGINVASPSDDANGPTSLSTTAQIKFKVPTSLTSPAVLGYTSGNTSTDSGTYVLGISVATDASVSDSVSLTTSTTVGADQHIGSEVRVFLNYPKATHINFGE